MAASNQTWPPVRSNSSYEESHRHVTGANVLAVSEPPAYGELTEVFTAQMVGGDLAFAALIFDGVLTLERPGVATHTNQASTPLVRALTCGLPPGPGLVIGRATAAWVHTGQHPPTDIDVLYERGFSPPALGGRPNFARSVFQDEDVQLVGPVRVTTPLRTVMDLAAWCTPAVATQRIFSFQGAEKLVLAALTVLEGRYNFRNKAPALDFLARLDVAS